MQKILKSFLSFCLAVAVCLGTAAVFGTAQYTVADAATADSYYNSITAESGNALLGQLHDLITTTHTYYTTYGECSESKYVNVTDPGPNGGALEFYTQESIMSFSGQPGTWNREHVWCKSLSNGMWKSVSNGTKNGGTDMHHIRPAESVLNSTRSSYKYGKVNGGKEAWSKDTSQQNVALGGWVGGGAFEPLDKVKGDVARIVMYVYTHYNTYSNVGGTTNGSGGAFGTLNFTHIMSPTSEKAAIELLLEWNSLDPVDQIERTRNEEVYKIQGNRNPFIDNSSYAEAIWGNGSVIDPGPGPGPQPSDTLKSIYLNASSVTMYTGQTYDLIVTPNPGNASASVTWYSSDTSVATVSNGKITAKAAGTTTITATSTVNPSIKASVNVTVKQSSSQGTASGKATITIDSFNLSSNKYDFFKWSADGLNGTAFLFSGNEDCMQFNTSKSSYYIASTSATSAPIMSITVKSYTADGKADRTWKLLTSTTPFGEVAGKPDDGTDWGTKTTTADGVTWSLSGNDTYFALVLEGSGAAYLDSIVVEYASDSGSEVPPPVVVGGGNIQAFHNAVAAIDDSGTLSTWRATINTAVAVYKNLSDSNKAEAADDIATLNEAIANYNAKVKAYNSADEAALKGAGIFL